jgi:hypothetical protein
MTALAWRAGDLYTAALTAFLMDAIIVHECMLRATSLFGFTPPGGCGRLHLVEVLLLATPNRMLANLKRNVIDEH